MARPGRTAAGKWLERLAEFKRDGRQADADELLAEFRRRFPDHPASAQVRILSPLPSFNQHQRRIL